MWLELLEFYVILHELSKLSSIIKRMNASYHIKSDLWREL